MICLGIDAAWTTTEPSGVALLVGESSRWTCRAVAPSYRQYVELAAGRAVDWTVRPPPGSPNVDEILAATKVLAGDVPDVIAVDMPLAFAPITGRRASDTKISQLFGAAGAAVHSPSAIRPGQVAERLRLAFEQRGYALEVSKANPPHGHALIETYPHPIVMWLCDTRRRVPYKLRRSTKYWPALPLADRRRALLVMWQEIILAIGRMVDGTMLPPLSAALLPGAGALKALEDGIDALICAIAGISYLNGTAIPYGDDGSAIWLPRGCEAFVTRADRFAGPVLADN